MLNHTARRMTAKQAAVLQALSDAGVPLSAREVGQRIGVSPHVAASRLWMMELKRLVANTWDCERPGAHWLLTDAGAAELADWTSREAE